MYSSSGTGHTLVQVLLDNQVSRINELDPLQYFNDTRLSIDLSIIPRPHFLPPSILRPSDPQTTSTKRIQGRT